MKHSAKGALRKLYNKHSSHRGHYQQGHLTDHESNSTVTIKMQCLVLSLDRVPRFLEVSLSALRDDLFLPLFYFYSFYFIYGQNFFDKSMDGVFSFLLGTYPPYC